MSTTKKIEDWLSELPDGYRERALRARREHQITQFGDQDNIAEALLCGFDWTKTVEGDPWWNKVYEHFNDWLPLPPLPTDNEPDQH